MSDTNYEFMDCGKGRRLERFGDLVIDRPAPQADFPCKLPKAEWEKAAARFIRKEKENRWEFNSPGGEITQETLFFYKQDDIRMELRFSPNGQIGIYPEQLDNWRWIKKQLIHSPEPLRVLNGFAYTGGSTLFSAQGGKLGKGADVCHLDASKSAVNWARTNAAASSLEDQTIRFIVEDIIRFMEREIKRGKSYHGIILDPPAFGRAPGKKTWVLKKDLRTLMDMGRELFRDDPRFFLISCHDPEISKAMLADQLKRLDGVDSKNIETRDLIIPSKNGNDLTNGMAARWSRLRSNT